MKRRLLWLICAAALAAGCAPPDPDAGMDYVRDGRQLRDVLREIGSDNPDISRDAMGLLAQYGPDDHAALPALCRAATDSNEPPRVRAAAVQALGHILPSTRESDAAITKAMNDPDMIVSRTAIKAQLAVTRFNTPRPPPPETPPQQ
jgi:HEAT repeat protein